MKSLMNAVAFVRTQFKKYWQLISAAGAYHVFSWIYDNPLWMAVELKWKFAGVVWMMVMALIINTVLLIVFRNKENKWILWSAIDDFSERQKEIRDMHDQLNKGRNPLKWFAYYFSYIPVKMLLVVLWVMEKAPRFGDFAALVFLSIFADPFIATMYLRHEHRDGLRMREIVVYLASSIISISYWAIRNGFYVEIIRHIVL